MSLWNQVQNLHPDAFRVVQSLYNCNFPIEVRAFMEDWIEASIHTSANFFTDPTDYPNGEIIESLMGNFISTFTSKVEIMVNKDCQTKFKGVLETLIERYKVNPLAIFKFLRHCISVERCLVGHFSGNAAFISDDLGWANVGDIVKQFTLLAESAERSQQNFHTMDAKMQQIHIFRVFQEIDSNPDEIEMPELVNEHDRVQIDIPMMAQNILSSYALFHQNITTTITYLDFLCEKVLNDKLNQWKCQQQGADWGSFNEGLDTIQLWCEDLGSVILNFRKQMRSIESFVQNIRIYRTQTTLCCEEWQSNWNKLDRMFSSLVKRSLVVEVQPPQVIIKGSQKFSVLLRSLIGSRPQCILDTLPQSDVSASIVPEEETKGTQHQGTDLRSTKECVLKNDLSKLIYNEESQRSVAYFPNLYVEKITRKGNKNEERTKHKFCIMFNATVIVDGKGYDICTPSLPVVVTVHGNQGAAAWGTIVWDDSFRFGNRGAYDVQENAPWCSVALAMNNLFARETGRPLTARNLNYLAIKFFSMFPECYDGVVEWTMLFKHQLTLNGKSQAFTFWEWFYATLKLTKDHFTSSWKQGLIEGFISKVSAEELLRSCGDNTFFLRFTESMEPRKAPNQLWKGSISIIWVQTDRNGQKVVNSLQPFNAALLENRPLSFWIRATQEARILYPNIPVESVFPLNAPPPGNGYVQHSLIIRARLADLTEVTHKDQQIQMYRLWEINLAPYIF
ncbi:unnamed protein product [Allacma fusca]|uniref:STAT transcription factor protein interaction domain-containing protein n=1 Tax=Allacma fusca TaxID=39272 RepID=A0A8J2P7S3_9HEXA|nr:unnamed protein product [Allacma fusca]